MSEGFHRREPIALFTREELATAFGLLLPRESAIDLARRWFELFVDDHNIDKAGRYLYTDWRDDPDIPELIRSQRPLVFTEPETSSSSGSSMYDWLVNQPPEQLSEILLSFSDLHLDLIALSSPDLRRRVELVRQGERSSITERRCRELSRALDQRREN